MSKKPHLTKEDLNHYNWYKTDPALNWVQKETFCTSQPIGTSNWQNGLDDNYEYIFPVSEKKIHMHCKNNTRQLNQVHIDSNNNTTIASLKLNTTPLSLSQLKFLLKPEYPNHFKLFDLVSKTYSEGSSAP